MVEALSERYDKTSKKEEKLILRGMLVGSHLKRVFDKNDDRITEKYLNMAVNTILNDELKKDN